YGPSGILAGSAFNGAIGGIDTELSVRATNNGIYTVVVNSYYANGSGPYTLNLAQSPEAFVVSPGDQGGPMTNGSRHTGMIEAGDLDLWSFSANAGESIILRMGSTGFNPDIRLYGPNGALAGSIFNGTVGGIDTELSLQATNN